MDLSKLIAMSNRYGSSEDYVLAGGGNTSYKEDGKMAVKASATQLATITEDGFVLMDVAALTALLHKSYPGGDAGRESAALDGMMAARLPRQAEKRPSVECILHALFPFRYVLHLHPALVNGLTCGVNGAEIFNKMAEEGSVSGAVWVPLTKPGIILSQVCSEAFENYAAAHGAPANMLMLQNHGVFAAADTVEEIDAMMSGLMDALSRRAGKAGAVPNLEPAAMPEGAGYLGAALKAAYGEDGKEAYCVFTANPSLLAFAESEETMRPLLKPFSPDHIVYCKAEPLYIEEGLNAKAADAFSRFKQSRGFAPKVAVVRGAGAFALGASQKEADTAAKVFVDAVKIASYSAAFGGPLTLPDEFTRFIQNWEVESYRTKQSFKQA